MRALRSQKKKFITVYSDADNAERVKQETLEKQKDYADSVAAAKLLKNAPALISFDTSLPGYHDRLAELVMVAGYEARFNFVKLCIDMGASHEAIGEIVNTGGQYGPDRMLALWWAGLNEFRILSYRHCKDPASTNARIRELSDDVMVLAEKGLLRSEHARELKGINSDPDRSAREVARRELAIRLDKWNELADINKG